MKFVISVHLRISFARSKGVVARGPNNIKVTTGLILGSKIDLIRVSKGSFEAGEVVHSTNGLILKRVTNTIRVSLLPVKVESNMCVS